MIQTARTTRVVTSSNDIFSAHLLVLLLLIAFSSSSPSIRRSVSPTAVPHLRQLQPPMERHVVQFVAVTPTMLNVGMSHGGGEDHPRPITVAPASAGAKKRRRPIITGDPTEGAGSTTSAVDQSRVPVTESATDEQVAPPHQLHTVVERYAHPRRGERRLIEWRRIQTTEQYFSM